METRLDPRQVRFALFIIAMVAFTVVLFLMAPLIWSAVQIFIIAGLIALALNELVRWQVARGIPRWLATVGILLVLVLITGLLLTFLLPPLIGQAQQFIADAPAIWASAYSRFNAFLHNIPQLENFQPTQILSSLFSGARSWVAAAQSVFATAVGAITASVLIIVTVLYTLLDPWPLLYGVRGLFPREWWPTVDRLATESANRIRGWIIGTLVLSLAIAVLDYLGLLLINIFYKADLPFILFFAILGGLLEIVPVVGPIIASIVPAVVGFAIDPFLGVLVLLVFFIIQQLENNVLVPVIMHKAVNMHPVSLIIALFVLSGLFGVFGAIIAVPVASVLKVIYDDWYYPMLHHGETPMTPPEEQAEERAEKGETTPNEEQDG